MPEARCFNFIGRMTAVQWNSSIQHSQEPTNPFNYAHLQKDSGLWTHYFKIQNCFLKACWLLYSKFLRLQILCLCFKGRFFCCLLSSRHIGHFSFIWWQLWCLGPFCSCRLSVNLAWWFQTSYVAVLRCIVTAKMANNPCSQHSAVFDWHKAVDIRWLICQFSC